MITSPFPARAARRLRGLATVALAGSALVAATLAIAAPATAATDAKGSLSPNALVSSTGAVLTPTEAASLVSKAGLLNGTKASTGKLGGASGASTESIIGADNRFRVTPTTTYPYRANVLIERSTGALHCTGWMVSKDTLLTAGHCVHTGGSSGTWYSGLRFKAGSDGGTAPYGTCLSRGTWALNGWVNSGSTNFDAAIVKLNCTVGNTVGWYGMWWQSASLNGFFTRVSGYPGDKAKQQWMSYDQVRATQTEKIYYQNDTIGGMSGSPVWQFRATGAAFCGGGPCAMAIHTQGTYGTGLNATNNSGTRITQAKFNTFVSIINLP